jgi:hypothetical protein
VEELVAGGDLAVEQRTRGGRPRDYYWSLLDRLSGQGRNGLTRTGADFDPDGFSGLHSNQIQGISFSDQRRMDGSPAAHRIKGVLLQPMELGLDDAEHLNEGNLQHYGVEDFEHTSRRSRRGQVSATGVLCWRIGCEGTFRSSAISRIRRWCRQL